MSFRLKTILGIAFIEGGLLLLLIWMGLNMFHQSQEDEVLKHAATITTLFATTTKDAVLSSDLASLESFTDEVMKNPELVYARVLDQNGEVMAERGENEILATPYVQDTHVHDVKQKDHIFDSHAEILEGGRVYGQVQVGLNTDSIYELLDKARSNATAIVILEMSLVALFSFVLGTWLTRQIKALETGAHQITNGVLGYQLKVRGNDELAKTASAFNAMSSQVKQLYEQLSDNNKELEKHIIELSDTNEQLESSKKHLASVFDTMLDGLIIIDKQGLIRDYNSAAESIFGYSPDEVLGRNVSMLMPDPDSSQHDAYINRYLDIGKTKIIGVGREVNGMRKDGSVFPMELALSEASSGNAQSVFTGIIRDISQRKQDETALAMRHKQLKTIQRAQADFISGGDPVEFFEGLLPDILELSDSEYGLIGEAREDEHGKPYLKAYALTNISWDEDTRKFYEENAPQGLEFTNLDNLLGKVILDGKPVISNDPRHDPHAKGLPPGHPPLNAYLGLPVYLGTRLMGMIGVANRPAGYSEEVIERLQPILGICAQLFDALGKERERSENMEQLQQEVAARKRAQAELNSFNETLEQRVTERTNEQQALYLVSSILSTPEISLEEIFNTILIAVLPSLSDQEETCARIIFDDKSYQTRNFQVNQRTVSSPIIVNGEQHGVIEIFFLEERSPDKGKSFEKDKELLLAAISNEIRSTIEYRSSLEEHQKMEIRLHHAQKLEAVGQLAAGIAHEINTPTQFVNDNTHFLQEAFADYERLLETYDSLAEEMTTASPVSGELLNKVKTMADEIDVDYLKEEVPQAIKQSLEGLARISRIVQAMKEFSHPGTEVKTPTDLNRAIETTVDVSRNEWRYHSDLITKLDPELPQVPVLPGEFNQVMLNLIVNAAHAIQEETKEGMNKGEIVISTRRAGEWVEITVSDNGAGMPDKIKNRIFDPFFTTKEVGKGTGQGLALTWSVIVDIHNGTLDVKSEEGVGTTFTIHLPILEAQPS